MGPVRNAFWKLANYPHGRRSTWVGIREVGHAVSLCFLEISSRSDLILLLPLCHLLKELHYPGLQIAVGIAAKGFVEPLLGIRLSLQILKR